MINENEAVSILSKYLISHGFSINQQLDTKTKGVDIIAEKDKTLYFIEVKGETPASPSSKRYGKPFTSSQIKVHIAEAIYKTLFDIGKSDKEIKFAIAFPDTVTHFKYVNRVLWSLKHFGILVYLINKDSIREI